MTLTSALIQKGVTHLIEKGIPNPRHEIDAMLIRLLSLPKIDLYIHRDRPVSSTYQAVFIDWITRRGQREPLQYILGRVDFFGYPFFVAQGVFIPRPETEGIVEIACSLPDEPRSILDLCTGSGALAIVLAMQWPKAHVTAIDSSHTALAVARINQKRHGTTNINFNAGDIFDLDTVKGSFDLIVCNPPYIGQQERGLMDPEVFYYEPHTALFSQEEGFAHLIQVLKKSPALLSKKGSLLLEIGAGQAAKLNLFVKNETPFTATFHQDLAGIDRIALCQWTK